MRNPLARGLIALAAVAAAVVLFVVLAGGDDDNSGNSDTTATTPTQATIGTAEQKPAQPKPAQPAVERIVVAGGKPRGGVKRLSFKSGDRVQFMVTSDVTDEVHVHGYDVSKDVPAGGSVRFSFPARIEGVFEIELEDRHEQIAELRISPG
jgi:hypothetical protein